MGDITVSDFSAGMVQRISPEDYNKGEWGKLIGFVVEDDKTIRSQWPIQTVGSIAEDSFYFDAPGTINSIYPLKSTVGTFLIAIRTDGSIWWTRAPESHYTYLESQNSHGDILWHRLTTDDSDAYTTPRYAQNQGYLAPDAGTDGVHTNQPAIEIESNPDYRFITELPFEVYKYIRKATANNVNEFNKDEIADTNSYDENGNLADNANPHVPKSVVSGVLIHSRRYVKDGILTRGKDALTEKLIASYSLTSNVLTVNTTTAHNYSVNQTVAINIPGTSVIEGSYYIVSTPTTTSFTVAKTYANIASTIPTGGSKSYIISRTQVAVVCYIDPYEFDELTGTQGAIKAATFPNIRRWPVYSEAAKPTFSSTYVPMKPFIVNSAKNAVDTYPFIAKYPYDSGSIINPNDALAATSAYPKDTSVFHPYTWLDKDKAMHPGTGFIPRANIGAMWNNNLILGDIEWREDSSQAYLLEKNLTPTKNTAVLATQYSHFGLRDGNTEPHRGFLYYSNEEIDKFDPRSVLKASGTDTRITGMHTINNRLICITSAGGANDGVISFSGMLAALHPYTPGVLSNPLSVRKEIIKGGVGTADDDDEVNHGNPQSVLWPEMGKIAFIDKTGFVYTTDGATCSILDERYPLKGRPNASTVNDHVAAVGKNLFIYKNGYLFCYTVANGQGAWTILLRPEAWWQSYAGESSYKAYNVIKSMKGIGTELYMVVDTYYQLYNTDFTSEVGDPVLSKSRVMRYALNGPTAERGMQDGVALDGQEIETPTLGSSTTSKNIDWFLTQLNIYTENGCSLNAIQVKASYPVSADSNAALYTRGVFEVPAPDLNADYTPKHLTHIKTWDEGFWTYECTTGVGPQKVLSVRYSFSGDVRINSVSVKYNGTYSSGV